MSAHSLFRLRNPLLMAALLTAYPALAQAAGAASIDFAAGRVTAISASGERPLTKGAEIGNGDTIRTADGSRAQVRFSDGALVSLQPRSEFRIDNYEFSGKEDGQEKGFFSLLKGGLRTITGFIGRTHRNNYKVSTAVATIGIRGTEYTVQVEEDGTTQVHTGEGLIEISGTAGSLLLASGESGIVRPDTPPQRTEIRPQLPLSEQVQDPSLQPVVSSSENRDASGGLTMDGVLLDGDYEGFSVAVAYRPVGGPAWPTPNIANADVEFSAGRLVEIESSSGAGPTDADIDSSRVVDYGGAGGVINWGRWVGADSGEKINGSDLTPGSTLHYVAGLPTPNIAALSGAATYVPIGWTSPTNASGEVGTLISGGVLTATFKSGVSPVDVSLTGLIARVGGTTETFSQSGHTASETAPSFSLGTTGSVANGFFAGANASHAGLAYHLSGIQGAVAYKKQ